MKSKHENLFLTVAKPGCILILLILIIWNHQPSHAGNDDNWSVNFNENQIKKIELMDKSGGAGQYYPAIDLNSSEEFIVVWRDNRNGYNEIFGQFFNSDGMRSGNNFKISKNTNSEMLLYPRVAISNTGTILVVWQDKRSSYFDIYGQFCDHSGNLIGNNFKINDDAGTAAQTYPDVAVSPDGTFLVVFQDQRSGFAIRGQRYNSTGSKLESNFIIASASWCGNAKVVAASDNTFIVAWEENSAGIKLKKYNSGGTVLSSIVSASSTGRYPGLAINGSGNFAIIWENNNDIYLQRFSQNCSKLGSSTHVNDDLGSKDQSNGSIAMDSSGNFIVVWCDYRNDNDDDIWNGGADLYAQKFSTSGSIIGNNFMIHDCSDNNYYIDSDIAMSADGDFVFTWEDRRDGDSDIYARRFFANTSAKGADFMVNDDKALPNVVVTPTSFFKTLKIGEIVTETLTITNTGSGALTFSISDKTSSNNSGYSGNSNHISAANNNKGNIFNPGDNLPKFNKHEVNRQSQIKNDYGISIGMIHTGRSNQQLPYPYTRLTDLGYQVTLILPASDLAIFQNYDIIYLPTNWADAMTGHRETIESHASEYQTYVNQGGCLFVEQPNYSFSTSVLPYPITFYNGYDSGDWPPVIVNPKHEITQGLPENEMPGPADQMPNVAPEYEILVKGRNTGSPSLVVSTYGLGKILVHSAHPSSTALNPFSDRVYQRMIEWLARSEEDALWLTEDPTSGNLQAGDAMDITVTFDATDLEENTTYNAHIVLNCNDPNHSIIEIPVQLMVSGSLITIKLGDEPYWYWSFYQEDTVVVALNGSEFGLGLNDDYLVKYAKLQFTSPGSIEFHVWEIDDRNPNTILGKDLIQSFDVNVTDTYHGSLRPDIWQMIELPDSLVIKGSQFIGFGYVLKQDAPDPKLLTDSTTIGDPHLFVYTTSENKTGWYRVAEQPMFQLGLVPATHVLEIKTKLPHEYWLSQNYPNPFNPSTTIEYALEKDSHISIKIFNSIGQEIAKLADNHQQAGHYTIQWDASNQASGIYFVQLKANGFSKTMKMMLVQ